MADLRDQDYLLHNQYKDATNFNARIDLHRRFSINKHGWQRWVFDQLQIGAESRILELGCGPGMLWLSNRERIPANWQIVLTDFSPGMLQEARQQLGESRFTYQVADAQALPFADACFDAVIANHMLYHVPDLPRALEEIRRVLKPAGRLYATTIGREHMHEMDELISKAQLPAYWQKFRQGSPFDLENGEEQLAPLFSQITRHIYEDELEVTEAEPLVAYALSGKLGMTLANEQREKLVSLVREELAIQGTIHITKSSGMFEALKGF